MKTFTMLVAYRALNEQNQWKKQHPSCTASSSFFSENSLTDETDFSSFQLVLILTDKQDKQLSSVDVLPLAFDAVLTLFKLSFTGSY